MYLFIAAVRLGKVKEFTEAVSLAEPPKGKRAREEKRKRKRKRGEE